MAAADRPAGIKKIPRNVIVGASAAALLAPVAAQLRVRRAARPLSDRWQQVPVEPAGGTLLGLSFRPLQAEALGLDPRATLQALLDYPYQLIRLAAYWDRMEPEPGRFDHDELDWMVDAAERAGKQIILCVGPVKAFGYPEFFVPAHHLDSPLPEGALIEPAGHQELLRAATAFARRVVRRYRDRAAIVAWQVEHEVLDPLGVEHSWRLSRAFARAEVDAVRAADPARPVMMNGFLPTSAPVALQQWWRTRDQGDSLSAAEELADIVGIDFYPRHALLAAAGQTAYLDGSRRWWQQRRRRQLFARAAVSGRRVMIAEGQAEPWEAVTTPPSPPGHAMYSCLPEHVIENFSQCMRWQSQERCAAWAYLFWGAEYWVLRQQQGDPRYLDAFARVLSSGRPAGPPAARAASGSAHGS